MSPNGEKIDSFIIINFSVGCDQSLNGSVLQVFSLHDSHDGSHAQSVVGTQGCAFSLYPVAVDICLNGVGNEVVCAVFALLRHHVHVCLQDNALEDMAIKQVVAEFASDDAGHGLAVRADGEVPLEAEAEGFREGGLLHLRPRLQ